MACRTPVLATRAGAAPDLIDDRNGRLLDATPEAFVTAMAEFAALPPAQWKALSEAAYTTAQSYTWALATERLLSVLTNGSAPAPVSQPALGVH